MAGAAHSIVKLIDYSLLRRTLCRQTCCPRSTAFHDRRRKNRRPLRSEVCALDKGGLTVRYPAGVGRFREPIFEEEPCQEKLSEVGENF
jgi:hypothetical protein